jgi:uncharacterized membrane protein
MGARYFSGFGQTLPAVIAQGQSYYDSAQQAWNAAIALLNQSGYTTAGLSGTHRRGMGQSLSQDVTQLTSDWDTIQGLWSQLENYDGAQSNATSIAAATALVGQLQAAYQALETDYANVANAIPAWMSQQSAAQTSTTQSAAAATQAAAAQTPPAAPPVATTTLPAVITQGQSYYNAAQQAWNQAITLLDQAGYSTTGLSGFLGQTVPADLSQMESDWNAVQQDYQDLEDAATLTDAQTILSQLMAASAAVQQDAANLTALLPGAPAPVATSWWTTATNWFSANPVEGLIVAGVGVFAAVKVFGKK